MIGDILQPTHLIFLLLVALLVLGPKRLPEAGRSLGKGLRSFRSAMEGIESEASGLLHHDDEDAHEEPALVNEPEPVPSLPAAATTSAAPEPTVVASSSREPAPEDYAD